MPKLRAFCLVFTVFFLCISSLQAKAPKIDKVEVFKSQRRMELLTQTQDGLELVKAYDISLGAEPLGHKTQEGDNKTPEGTYTIDWKNPKSSYHLSLHISYPNKQDEKQARERGVSPGGEIFIHGMPNNTRPWAWLISPAFNGNVNDMIHSILSEFDWTRGCIAVLNHEIEEIYKWVKTPTPIEIFP